MSELLATNSPLEMYIDGVNAIVTNKIQTNFFFLIERVPSILHMKPFLLGGGCMESTFPPIPSKTIPGMCQKKCLNPLSLASNSICPTHLLQKLVPNKTLQS